MNKTNKVLVVLVIILSILVLALGGYMIYDNFIYRDNIIQNSNNENQNNVGTGNSVLKLDNSKDWVYDASYYLPTNKESYYGYSDHTKLISAIDLVVPYINIDTADAKKVNQEIYELYEDLINTFNENLKEEIWFTLVKYDAYINNNIISIVITTESAGTDVPMYNYYTYNFNLYDGNLLSYSDAYKTAGLNESNIENKALDAITDTMKNRYTLKDEFDTYNNKSINNYKTSVDNDTIKFFIDEYQKLNVIVTLEIPAGIGQFDTIIAVE